MWLSACEKTAMKDSKEKYFTDFFEAVDIGLISAAKFYLGLNSNLLNCIKSKKGTALICAVQNDDADMVEFLIEAGADAKVSPFLFHTPLELASECGYESVVIQILTSVPNIDKQKSLFYAVREGHENIVTLLIDAGADVNRKSSGATYFGHTLLYCAIDCGHERLFKRLLDAGADPFQLSGRGCAMEISPLSKAALEGNVAMVAQLLALGAEIDRGDCHGCTALHMAAYLGNDKVVSQLILAGADINKLDRYHRTPIHDAARNGHEKVVKILSDALAYVSDSSRHTKAAIKVSNLSSLPMLIKLEIVSRLVGTPGLNDYQVTQILK